MKPHRIPLIYVAHPLSGDIKGNIAKAKRHLRDLIGGNPSCAFVASWVTYCEVLDDTIPEHRARGMRDDFAVISRCDAVYLVGSHVSGGMRTEAEYASSRSIDVFDITEAAARGEICEFACNFVEVEE